MKRPERKRPGCRRAARRKSRDGPPAPRGVDPRRLALTMRTAAPEAVSAKIAAVERVARLDDLHGAVGQVHDAVFPGIASGHGASPFVSRVRPADGVFIAYSDAPGERRACRQPERATRSALPVPLKKDFAASPVWGLKFRRVVAIIPLERRNTVDFIRPRRAILKKSAARTGGSISARSGREPRGR